MTRDVTIEQEADTTATAALNRRTVLGALSLGLVAAACSSGSEESSSGSATEKSVASGDSSGSDEIRVSMPSPDSGDSDTDTDSDTETSGSVSEALGDGVAMSDGSIVPGVVSEVRDPATITSTATDTSTGSSTATEAPTPTGTATANPTAGSTEVNPVAPSPSAGLPAPDVPLTLGTGTGIEAIRIANRITFGTTPAVQDDILLRGTAGFIENQLALNTGDPVVEAKIAEFSTITQTRQAQFAAVTAGKDNEVGRIELTMANALRATESQSQLFEIMCQLWQDHLNVSLPDTEYESLVTSYQEEVIRPNALGNFSDMLRASAEHPAMLVYLDAADNDATNPEGINENYGREILELHTLGKNPQVYSEDDVRAAAFAFTGWTFDQDQNSPTFLEFQFDEARHFTGPISIVDGAFDRGATTGKATADALITFLLGHELTAKTIATKLCTRFISDSPSDEIVASTAAVFAANETAIVPTLVHIFNSQEFANSDGQKLRRPYEALIATMRAMGAELPANPASDGARIIRDQIAETGNEPWMKDTPDGYSDQAVNWLSTATTIDFWNTSASAILGTLTPEVTANLDTLRLNAPATAGEFVVSMGSQFGLGVVSPEVQAAILTAIGAQAATPTADLNDAQVQDIASLLIAHPLFCIR